MIRTPTVFVLGAGASAPYGFPLGTTLLEMIQSAAIQGGAFLDALCAAGSQPRFVEQFGRDLEASGLYALDEFLQWHPQHKPLGKLAIALSLIPHESDDRFSGSADHRQWTDEVADRRWYRYLFNRLLMSRTGRRQINTNQVTFLTFNFDRSFERALYLFVRANCAASDAEAIQQLRSIAIHHLHGQLGSPAWLSTEVVPAAGARAYDPQQTAPFYLRMCADQIRIVDDEVASSLPLRLALDALENAQVVAFLGFSFHPMNLSKLHIEKLNGKRVLGTAYKLPLGPRTAVERTFNEAGGIELLGIDDHVLTFLEKTDLIYD